MRHEREEEIKARFCYDAKTGVVMATYAYGRQLVTPRPVGWKTSHGYIRMQCGKKHEYAHVIAWVIRNGSLPEKGLRIDHINRDRSDNRECNLRLVDGSEHCANRSQNSSCKSGRKGVCWSKRSSMWQMSIQYRGRRITKLFYDLDAAANYYDSCAKNFDEEYFATNAMLSG